VPINSLADIAALAEHHRDRLFKVNLKSHVRLVRVDPGHIQVGLTETAPKTLLGDLTTRLKNWTGRNWLVSVSKDAGGQTLAEVETAKRENAIMDARNDPAVAAVLARFPGAKIIDVRIPDSMQAGADAEPADLSPEAPVEDDDEI
jgi:DNA polymerase-3 subunit gamma/tau